MKLYIIRSHLALGNLCYDISIHKTTFQIINEETNDHCSSQCSLTAEHSLLCSDHSSPLPEDVSIITAV